MSFLLPMIRIWLLVVLMVWLLLMLVVMLLMMWWMMILMRITIRRHSRCDIVRGSLDHRHPCGVEQMCRT